MCHLLLLLPLLALPVFWIWPISVSLPAYALTSGISVAAYVAALKAMRRPVLTGRECMVGATGHVVGVEDGRVTVEIGSELWAAQSDNRLTVGDVVRVASVDGLRLRVEPVTEELP